MTMLCPTFKLPAKSLLISMVVAATLVAAPLRAEGIDIDPRAPWESTQEAPQLRLCLPNLAHVFDISRLWRSGVPENRYVAAVSVLAVVVRGLTCK